MLELADKFWLDERANFHWDGYNNLLRTIKALEVRCNLVPRAFSLALGKGPGNEVE